MEATKMNMGKQQFDRYLKYINFWLNTNKKRALNIEEEDTLYIRLDTAAREYDADAEQYDLMSVLCITAAITTMEIHPQMDDASKQKLQNRINKLAKKKK